MEQKLLSMTNLPKSRRSDVVVQELASEVLIYDLKTNKALALNKTATTVYHACDGKTSFAELKRTTKFTDEIIFLSLDELKKENLLETDSYSSPFVGMTRREIIRRVGLATMIALPVISSIVAPHAVHAASGSPPSACPTGTAPSGTHGNGDTCGCGTNVGAGNTCGIGTTGSIPSTCRTGCVCRADACSPVTSTCVGLCE